MGKHQATHHIDAGELPRGVVQSIRDFCERLRGLRVSTPFMCALVEELPYHRDGTTGLVRPVCLTNDFTRVANSLGTAQLMVGSSAPEPSSIRGMLRLCAPLAQNGWLILCELTPDHLKFGVVASDQNPASLRSGSDDGRGFPMPREDGVVSIAEPSRGVIAIQAATDEVRVHWKPPTVSREQRAVSTLIAAMSEATGSQKSETRNRLQSIFSTALADSRGVLVAVVQRTWGGGWPCEDAAFPPQPIDLLSLAPKGQDDKVGLGTTESLVVSMIQSDGIVVFDNAARLRAYRWFVRLQSDENRLPGGARERAFRALKRLVEGDSPLLAAFIQSGDRTTQFVGANDTGNASQPPAAVTA